MLPFPSLNRWRHSNENSGGGNYRQPGPAPTIFVDVSVILKRDSGTGIQRVVRALYRELLDSEIEGYSIRPVFATRYRGYRRLDPHFLDHSLQARKAIGKVKIQPGDIFLGLDLAAHVIPRHKRQLAGWKEQGLKIYLVVYDLLPLTRPEWFNPKLCGNFRKWKNFLEHHADGAICISRHVRNELARLLDRAPHLSDGLTLSTIRLGADIRSSLPSAGISAEQSSLLDRISSLKSILMVGTIEPRKGHEEALSAFEAIWKSTGGSDMALVIVGKPGWKTEPFQARLRAHSEQGSKLFWVADASDELLERLYDASEGVLAASFDEGFGLPVIEAAHHGKKILARDIRVFREIAPPWTHFFEGPNELSEAILAWVQEPLESSRLSAVKQTTWNDAHQDLLRAMAL